ncbi:MAG: GpE family phage tail protein [Candidatus Accumulibacter sp.]|nr:GpE family phage tail protein [Accumulibacter sp.]
MIAFVFHFPPSEIWNMPLSEMAFWRRKAEKIVRGLAR